MAGRKRISEMPGLAKENETAGESAQRNHGYLLASQWKLALMAGVSAQWRIVANRNGQRMCISYSICQLLSMWKQ
jgi:hypothetical protein